MKLKEKLIRDYLIQNAHIRAGSEMVDGPIGKSYLAGFEKAREMALNLNIYEYSEYQDQVRSLGEEEVE